jgi:outer membrane protein, adhesin transport system
MPDNPGVFEVERMHSRTIMAYAACAFFGLVLTPVPALSETLATAVSQALQSYPEIQAALADRSAAAEELVATNAQRSPRIDLSTRNTLYRSSAGTSDGVTVSLSANQSLYDGGVNASDRSRRQAELDAEGQRVADQATEVSLQAVTAYLDVMQSRDNLLAIRRNIDVLRDIARRVALRVEAGFGADTDLLDVQLKLQGADLSLVDAEDQAAKAEINYRNLVGLPPGKLKPVIFPKSSLPSDVETAVALARETSPKVLALVYEAQAADAAVSGVRAATRPQVGLDLGVNHTQDVGKSWDDSQDFSARVTLSVNLFDGGLSKARVRKARYAAYASRYRAATTGLAMEQRIRLAWTDMQTGRQRIEILSQQQKTARKSLALYLKRFDAGVEPLQKILDLQSQSASADLARVAASYGTLATGFRLLAGTGRLLSALGIEFDGGVASNG